jgi:hypothetical protein
MFRTLVALVALTCVVALSACGGSSSDSLSKSQLADKADSICKSTNAKLKGLGQPTSADQLPDYYQKALALAKTQEADLKGLKPADDVKDQWNSMLALVSSSNGLLQQIVDASKTTAGKAKLQSLSAQGEALNTKLNAAADALGATVCGSKSGG